MKDILQELEEVTEWHYLGLCLGVEESRLKAIRKDNKGNENRKRAMLFAWSKLKIPTWRRIVRALLEMGEKVLAEKIAKKYGKFVMVFICINQSIMVHQVIWSPRLILQTYFSGVLLPKSIKERPRPMEEEEEEEEEEPEVMDILESV